MFDLHTHVLPGVDDGAPTVEDGRSIVAALADLGFEGVVATPHIRLELFPNRPAGLRRRFADTAQSLTDGTPINLALAAEHHVDEGLLSLQRDGELLTYPDGASLLIELPYDRVVPSFDAIVFRLSLAGLRPLLAHPERCRELRDAGTAWPYASESPRMLLDVRALVGAYGADARDTAKRWLYAGHYFAACTDSHTLADVEASGKAIEVLKAEVGKDTANKLLSEAPRLLFEPS